MALSAAVIINTPIESKAEFVAPYYNINDIGGECDGTYTYYFQADGTPAEGIAGGYGYANADGTLMTNTQTIDWEGRSCYLQGNGVALY